MTAEAGTRRRILIVDDTPANIDVMGAILSDDYDIVVAINGKMALDIVHSKQQPDLIILDIMMPGMDGYEVIKALKSDHTTRQIPIIFATAKIEEQDEAKGFALGAADYIRKPVSRDITRARVKAHLELKALRERLQCQVNKKIEEVEASRLRLQKSEAEKNSIKRVLRHTEDTSKKHQIFFSELFSNSPYGILLVGTSRTILKANKSFCRLTGESPDRVTGNCIFKQLNQDTGTNELTELVEAAFSGKTQNIISCCVNPDGSKTPISALAYPVSVKGKIEGIFMVFENISERKKYEEKLKHQAFHDPLTGIPNRSLLSRRLSHALVRKQNLPGYQFALMLIDIDRFKSVNDSLGHLVGDQLLISISKRIQSCLREQDTIARLGGDEFAILLDDISDIKQVTAIAKRIKAATDKPFHIAGHTIHISASTGIVSETDHYENAQQILRDADFAMYNAKDSGKACFKEFNSVMHDRAMEKLSVEKELRDAISVGRLQLHYQPIMHITTGRLGGFEALIRWNHPVHGFISPERFIPVAEESDLILTLGEWMITEALSQLKDWQRNLPSTKKLKMNINISVKHFQHSRFMPYLLSALDTTDVSPDAVNLELTESLLLMHSRSTVVKIDKLRNLGIGIAIDDFGTGYGSMSYLQQFSVNSIKIDRSFTSRIGVPDGSFEIVKSLISLSHGLGIQVVAEGVETTCQLDILKNLGCNSAQGYLFSPPLAAELAGAMVLE
ncbi:MAG: hypothetical protein CSA22_03510 [Deltaproteobacteria bacterium]|nr:MAG: hypothetical protein CSA22_03510 [Deltaproteobacteria bacterium]